MDFRTHQEGGRTSAAARSGLEADYSQIELRVLAELSQDAALLDAFATDIDVHARTAGLICGVPEEAVSADQRRVGKAVNFGIIYGQSVTSLADQLGIPEDEADQAIYRFFRGHAGVARWVSQIEQEAANDGYVLTHYCRRRRPAGLGRGFGSPGTLRQAVNAVIQGTAADIMKMAIVRAHEALPSGCSLLLTVHDSLLVEAPSGDLERVSEELRQAMEQAPLDFCTPLKVNLRTGSTWAECKETGHDMQLELAAAN